MNRARRGRMPSLELRRVAIAADYIALNKALGGGWSGLVDTGKPEVKDVNTGPHIASNRQLTTNGQK